MFQCLTAPVQSSVYLLLVALAMITSNLGARFMLTESDKHIEKILAKPYMKYLYVYCMAFVATRDAILAMIAVLIYSGLVVSG